VSECVLLTTSSVVIYVRYDDRVKTARFEEGQLVWYYSPRRRKGMCRKWECSNVGGFRVMKKLNDVNYIIQKSPRTKPIIVHIDRLTPYRGDIPAVWQTAADIVSASETINAGPRNAGPNRNAGPVAG